MPAQTNPSASSARPKVKRPNGAGSYFPYKGKQFRASIKDVHGKTRTKVFGSEIEAQEWLSDQRRARENGSATYALRPKDTVTQFLTQYLNSRTDIRHGTLKSYRGSVNRLHPLIGHISAHKLTARSIEIAYSQLQQKGYKPGTVKAAHRLLSVAYASAVRLNELPANPLSNVKAPAGKSFATKLIPSEDRAALYSAAAGDPYALARLDVGFTLGLRPGEVYGLMWTDIDFAAATITIERQVQSIPGQGMVFQPVKQGETRTIPLTFGQLAILMPHKDQQDRIRASWVEDEGLIFPNSVGRKLDARRDRRAFKELCDKAGVKQYQVYQMRKSCFSNMAYNGVDIRTIMDFSGHSQVSTVITSYVSSTNDSLRQAANKMDLIRPKY